MADKSTIERLKDQACEMRKNMLKLCHVGATHIGGDLSAADILTVLFHYAMKYDPKNPKWEGRDRFILSKGHAAGALYTSLAMAGYFELDYLFNNYRKLDSPFGEHPSDKVPGVEIPTGSLGHGLSISTGIALAARLNKKNHRVFALLGDGESQEGMVWEAAMAARHYKLGNLVAFIDRNGLSLDGETEKLMRLEPLADKWKAFGWNVMVIDGHSIEQIVNAIDNLPPVDSDTPTVIIAKTVKGKGVSCMENDVNWHAGSIDAALLEKCCAELDEARKRERGE
ncbi:MAG: transketolase [Tepidanaerobacteraceae bacterium]|nr:transketolase [Tepidanaerobacteraceae bacterium]